MSTATRGHQSRVPATSLLERRVLALPPRGEFVLTGLAWGLATGFAFWAGSAVVNQGGALVLAAVVVLLAAPRCFGQSLSTPAGLCMLAHAAAAGVAGVLMNSSTVSIVRYLALAPAFVVLVATVLRGPRAVHSLRLGLTVAGLVFVVYHLLLVDPTRLDRPQYRLTDFLNANGVGFIAAVVGVSLLDYGLALVRRPAWRVAALGGLAACALLCFATKSRTAMIAMLVGMVTCLVVRLGLRRSLPLAVALVLVGLVLPGAWYGTAAGQLDYTLALSDPHRNVQSFSQRAEIWQAIVEDIWLPSPVLGGGPGAVLATVDNSSHNGLLRNLGETGLLGTVPLVILLGLAAVHAWRLRHNRLVHFAIPLAVTGLVESMAESMFFSMGNPGSLLFMLGVAALAVPVRTWRRVGRRRRREAP